MVVAGRGRGRGVASAPCAALRRTTPTAPGGMQGNWTPLHVAAAGCKLEITKLLIDHGADIEATDKVRAVPAAIMALPRLL